jgi:hypothetical protein
MNNYQPGAWSRNSNCLNHSDHKLEKEYKEKHHEVEWTVTPENKGKQQILLDS